MRNHLFLLVLMSLIACGGEVLPLEADFSIEQTADLSVFLDASQSSPSSDIVRYDWSLGDGSTAQGQSISHRFANPGTYRVSLTITNRANERKELSKQVSLIAKTALDALTQAEPETSFIIDNTSKQELNWKLSWNQASTNPQAGEWFQLSPKEGRLPAAKQQEIRLSLRDNLKSGSYSATLTLEYSGGKQRFAVTALLGENADFSLSTEPDYSQAPPLSLEAGKGGLVQLNIARSAGFSEELSLSLVAAPQGISAMFRPEKTTATSSQVELAIADTVAPGDYSVYLKAETLAGQHAITPVLLRIINKQAGFKGFTTTLSPAQLELKPGASAKIQLNVNRSSGFSLPVQMTHNGLPQGATISYSENPVQTSAEISLKLSEASTPGLYTINFWGQADTYSSSINLSLIVKGPDTGDARIRGSVTTDNSLIRLTGLAATGIAIAERTAMSQPGMAAYVPGQVLIAYTSSALDLDLQGIGDMLAQRRSLTQSLAERTGLNLKHLRNLGAIEVVSFPQGDVLDIAKRLAQDPGVAYAEPNYYLYTQGIPNDERVSEQWHLAAAGLPVAWEVETGSSRSVVVAVIDSGFDLNHPDLKSKFVAGYDFCGSSNCAMGQGDSDPSNGQSSNVHGSHVAGIIAASGNNGIGVAGVAYGPMVKLLPVKIFDDSGSGATIANFINAIRWSVGLPVQAVPLNKNPARIINMSLGAYFDSKSVQAVINEARAAGALLIAATGNDGINRVMSPAAADNVLGVGSINPSFKRSCFSNYGSDASLGTGKVDIMAPGGEGGSCTNIGVLSTVPNGLYGHLAGTSMAAPVVSAVAALIVSQEPNLSVSALEQRLLASSYFDSSYMTASEYGAGILRADLALGLPGPGSKVSLSASSARDSALDTVTLNLSGGSDSFDLMGLLPDSYVLEAVAVGTKYQLTAAASLNLSPSETLSRVLGLK